MSISITFAAILRGGGILDPEPLRQFLETSFATALGLLSPGTLGLSVALRKSFVPQKSTSALDICIASNAGVVSRTRELAGSLGESYPYLSLL